MEDILAHALLLLALYLKECTHVCKCNLGRYTFILRLITQKSKPVLFSNELAGDDDALWQADSTTCTHKVMFSILTHLECTVGLLFDVLRYDIMYYRKEV